MPDMMKRTFDFCVALFALCILALPMTAIAFIILATMGSPVLYVQERPGFKGKPFCLFKFRTMADRKDERGEPLPDGERLTGTGKFLRRLSFDELPQLFNVVKGELSLVGPRPLLMEYLHRYSREQARRHDVKPGITGWAQVNGRNAITWEEKFRLDVWYVDHRSFLLDMKILWLTAVRVFKQEGISAGEHATMPKFTGSGDKAQGG